ncbi:PREDICTED: trihelix transcription factor ASR3-like [Tarenaya hassleriana]|uniref:trihelix transcription factor ASR3-like n=1 Tax=Tarenaya hassleriana TaxID=28532 RepID=UPI00053C26B1|nr:PREDICTED: trihelix transcription factor ASR3-like [Tarenaya hassleriana]
MAQEQLSLGTSAVDGDANGVIYVAGGGGRGESRVSAKNDGGSGGGDDGIKTARLPRWTRQEILVLIQGKRVAENRVRRGRAVGSGMGLGSPGQVEPKWASVSSYCKRHGVNRGPVQCRKRWSNLAGDFKKIKEWESQIKDETESFWVMRNDLRRERKLPGFFDKEVYDILDGGAIPPAVAVEAALVLALAPASTSVEKSEPVFDSGRSTAAEEGLFSDFVEQEEPAKAIPTAVPLSVSEKDYQAASGAGKTNERRPEKNAEADSTSQEQRKRKRQEEPDKQEEEEEANSMQHQLIDVLERSGKMLATQLEAQNSNLRQDREQRKDFGDSLVAVLNKLADALGRIADKL